jgi:hypothetical protein
VPVPSNANQVIAADLGIETDEDAGVVLPPAPSAPSAASRRLK